jgi:tetratricopeptide (TPR) repeat protein
VYASLSAAKQQTDPTELALGYFSMAFPLMFAGRDAEAEPHYERAIELADRIGDAMLQTRFLAYAAICQRRLGRIGETRAIADKVLALATKQGLYDYVGVAYANLCWVAFRLGTDPRALAEQALDAWKRLPPGYPYPLQWLARIPLAAQLSRTGRTSEAFEHWRALLEPTQYALPEQLNDAIVLEFERGDDPSQSRDALANLELLSHKFALL